MARQASTDLDLADPSTRTSNLQTTQRKLKEISDRSATFVTWCLFGKKDSSSNFTPAEQLLMPRSTTYLTGLRGVAALFVYNFHLILDSFPNAVDPFVSWRVSSVFQLPVVRIVYAGGPMVGLFFIISGFVLSIKPLRLARQKKWTECFKSLASSVFRRGPRLFLPCVPSTFLVMLAAQLRLFPDGQKMVPIVQDSLLAQFADWISFFLFHVMNFWSFEDQNAESNYGPHLWTIPFEFRDSLILYVSVLGTAALRPNLFAAINIAAALFSFMHGKWDVALFFVGMNVASLSDRPILVSLRREIKAALAMVAFFVGVYLASLPAGNGSLWFASSGLIVPGVGLVLIMMSITHSGFLQRIFASKPIQYLGDVSFALYIIHEPILRLIGWRMVPLFAEKLGGSWALGLVCTWILITPPLLFLASLYTRFVEKPSLNLARWLESRCFVDISVNQRLEPELLDLITD